MEIFSYKVYSSLDYAKKIQRMLWARLIEVDLKCTSFYEVQKKFSTKEKYINKDGSTIRPTQWNKYARGEASPNKSTLQEVCKLTPRADYLLNLPMWQVLTRELTLTEIEELLLASRPDIVQKLFKYTGIHKTQRVRRSVKKHDLLLKWLYLDGSIDALNTIILLLAEIELTEQHSLVNTYQVGVVNILTSLGIYRPFTHFSLVLYEMIRNRFFYDFIKNYKALRDEYMFSADWVKDLISLNQTLLLYLEDQFVLLCEDKSKTLPILYEFEQLPLNKKLAIARNLDEITFKKRDYDEISEELKSLVCQALKVEL